LCEAALGNSTFTLNGDGTQSRDFTYVADAVDATVRAATAETSGVLNVGGGQEATMRDVITLLGRLAGSPVAIERSGAQRGDVRRTGADTTGARAELGWCPQTPLAVGLAQQLDWVAKRRSAEALVGAL
jgi:UDP-glucuronate 4-epimerase